jgi:competence protein ComEC
LKNTVQQIPFLRPVVALCIGILVGSAMYIPIAVLLAATPFLVFALYFIHQNFKFKLASLFGIGMHLLFVIIGVLVFEAYNRKPVFFEKGVFTATVWEQPQQKTNSFKSLLNITTVKTNNSVFNTNENILVYFEKDGSAEKLKSGDIIIFSKPPQPIKNFGNPFEFDYKKYLARKKIYRRVYLSSKQWKKATLVSPLVFTIKAEQFREQLLDIYRSQDFKKKELEILSALTLGYKRNLDPETKRTFSSAGAMHILAVSGLHVGIILWVITLLFGFLRKWKYGRILFLFISIGLLWFYAFITGLSPSVMRASTMFSIFVIGENINRKPNSYNSLAASALFLLFINPNNLFEIGFQLSYSAVFGIIFLQPKLAKILPVKNKIVHFFWTLLTVSLAAQIATFPITTFYFNQFPTYFLITNIVIIPAVMVLIPLGMALLLLSKIAFLSTIISTIIQFIIKICYFILSQIEHLPFSVFEISIRPVQFVFLTGTIISLFLFLKLHQSKFLKTSLLLILFLLFSSLALLIEQNKKTEIIVYNSSKNPTIQLIKGRNNIVISEHKIDDSLTIVRTIKNTNYRLKLKSPTILSTKDSLKSNYIFSKNGILLFEGKTILFNVNMKSLKQSVSPDFIISTNKIKNNEDLISKNSSIIICKKSNQKDYQGFNHIHFTSKRGAFHNKW